MTSTPVIMAANGRVVIPASMRAEIGLAEGGTMVARVENGVVVLEPHKVALDRVRAMVREFAPADPGLSVVDELIAERRAEALRE